MRKKLKRLMKKYHTGKPRRRDIHLILNRVKDHTAGLTLGAAMVTFIYFSFFVQTFRMKDSYCHYNGD
jgi:hypothetical protein